MGFSSSQLTGQTYHQEECPGESDETYVVSGLGNDLESTNLSRRHTYNLRAPVELSNSVLKPELHATDYQRLGRERERQPCQGPILLERILWTHTSLL